MQKNTSSGEERWKQILKQRLQKQNTFFNRKEKGDLILLINKASRGVPYLFLYIHNLLANMDVSRLCKKEIVDDIIVNYLNQLRLSLFPFYSIEDDAAPAMSDIFFHLGANIAAK